MQKKTPSRARTYSAILYPESAPADWRKILQGQFIKAIVSPLHDRDTTDTGEIKKPHHHILIDFDSPKTIKQAREVFESIGATAHVETVKSKQGYLRYLCHLDETDGAKYDPAEVVCMNGAKYEIQEERAPVDKFAVSKQIIQFCRDNDITNFADLVEYCADQKEEWLSALCTATLAGMIANYLKAKDWKQRKAQLQQTQAGAIKTNTAGNSSQPINVTVNVQAP